MSNRRKATNLMIDPGALLRLSAPLFFLLGANLLITLAISQQLSVWITSQDPSLNAKDYAQMTTLAASIRQTLHHMPRLGTFAQQDRRLLPRRL